MARPKITFTDRDRRAIEKLAGCGLSQEAISHALGISADTMTRRKAESPELVDAIARGRAIAETAVGEALYRRAISGDVAALRWFEATRFGRSEKHAVETRNITVEEMLEATEAAEAADAAASLDAPRRALLSPLSQ